MAWVLVSHGASGLGAWRVAAPRMPLPGAAGNEWSNTQALPAAFFRRGEAVVNPATGAEYAVNFLPKVKLEIVVTDSMADQVVDTIRSTAKTDKIGDGKIFVLDVEQALRVRTGETNEDAL